MSGTGMHFSKCLRQEKHLPTRLLDVSAASLPSEMDSFAVVPINSAKIFSHKCRVLRPCAWGSWSLSNRYGAVKQFPPVCFRNFARPASFWFYPRIHNLNISESNSTSRIFKTAWAKISEAQSEEHDVRRSFSFSFKTRRPWRTLGSRRLGRLERFLSWMNQDLNHPNSPEIHPSLVGMDGLVNRKLGDGNEWKNGLEKHNMC